MSYAVIFRRKNRSARRADTLFAGLDGRDLLVKGAAWHVKVYSVGEDAGRRWVQMAIDGPRHYTLTLALATRSGVQQCVDALSEWIERDSVDGHRLLVVS